MSFVGETVTILLGVATLIFISLYTLATCREQLPKRTVDYPEFLFNGKTKRYSLAGTIGSSFSVTYYGATTIYGHLYRGWFVIYIIITLVISIALVRSVVRAACKVVPQDVLNSNKSNILLELLRHRLGEKNLSIIVRIYALIYFGLIVEELAVSRLILSHAFPSTPIVTAVTLATICLVIVVYLCWGGFKAILISDYEQLKLIAPFTFAMGFLLFRDPPRVHSPSDLFAVRANSTPFALPLAILLLLSWISVAVDFYTRLNFSMAGKATPLSQRLSFVNVSLTLAFGVFIIGAIFGMFIPAEFSANQTPDAFTKNGIMYIVSRGSRATSVIFFASLFCMIFTTINTLLHSLLQLGYYGAWKSLDIKNTSRILLWAVLFSCLAPFNSVSAYGIFIGALMIVPLCGVLLSLSERLRSLAPRRVSGLGYAVLLSVLTFAVVYGRIETSYSDHYLLAGIVLICITICMTVAKLMEWYSKEEDKDGKRQDPA